MLPRLLFILMTLFIACPLPAQTTDFASAEAAYHTGDYRRAYKGLKNLAQEQHGEAQYLLGLLYLQGRGVKEDIELGIDWLKQATENGSYPVAAELGQIYITGKGVERNEAEAAKWIELSTQLAEAEDADEECD